MAVATKGRIDAVRAIFDALLADEGDVYAVHNGDQIKLKAVALAEGKIVGIVSTNSGGVKAIDITGDQVLRVTTEVIQTGRAFGEPEETEENE